MEKISIIGCGWLGKPLALELARTYAVRCFTRSAPKDDLLDYHLNPKKKDSFYLCDYLIIAISTRDNYLHTLKQISDAIHPDTTIFLTSSTSVYKEYDAQVDETVKITHPSMLVEAETFLQKRHPNVVVLRLGGLMGDDRIAGRWKSASEFTDGPVNYIHKEDVINIIQTLIRHQVRQGTFNLVAPEHPLRSEVHNSNAKRLGFEPGSFKGMSHRIVSSEKIIDMLEYRFIHPDPMEFWTSL